MLVAGLSFAVLAALVHVFIFYLKSIAWTTARARAVFGMTEAEAAATRVLAFNQGFYNLFLAVAVLVGVVLAAAGTTTVGITLVLTGAASMAAAALVLAVSSPDRAGTAAKQELLPALAVALTVVGLIA